MKASSHSILWLVAAALAGSLILAGSARAQNATQDVALVEGWNSVWLEVEPEDYVEGDTVRNDPTIPGDDEVLAAGDERIGTAKAPQDVFIDPRIAAIATPKPLSGPAEFFGDPGATTLFNQGGWEQWLRIDPPGSGDLAKISGNRPYLILVDGGATPLSLPITGGVRFFRPTWTPDRYNLVGFGIKGTISFEKFFAPSGLGGGAHPVGLGGDAVKIFALAPGGAWMPVTAGGAMKSNEAYWVYCDGPSEHMGPVAVDFDLAGLGVLSFGGPGDAVVVGEDPDRLELDLEEIVLTNLAATGGAAMPELELFAADPGLGTLDLHVVDPVPGSFAYARGSQVDSTAGDAMSAGLGVAVNPQSTEVLTLGALRNWSGGQAGRANLYRLRTGDPGTEFWLPVTAVENDIQSFTETIPASPGGSVAGLWVGEVIVDGVTSIVEDGAPVRPSAGGAPIRILLHSDDLGAVTLLSQVTVMQTKTADPEVEPVPVLVVDPAQIPFFEGIKERNGKQVGLRLEAVAYDMPRKIDATSQAALLADEAYPGLDDAAGIADFLEGQTIRPPSLEEDYHLSWDMGGSLGAGETVSTSAPLNLDPFHRSNPFRHAFHQQHPRGPDIHRTIEIVFDPGQAISGRLRGTFRETIEGLTKSNLELTGRVELQRVSTVDSLEGAE